MCGNTARPGDRCEFTDVNIVYKSLITDERGVPYGTNGTGVRAGEGGLVVATCERHVYVLLHSGLSGWVATTAYHWPDDDLQDTGNTAKRRRNNVREPRMMFFRDGPEPDYDCDLSDLSTPFDASSLRMLEAYDGGEPDVMAVPTPTGHEIVHAAGLDEPTLVMPNQVLVILNDEVQRGIRLELEERAAREEEYKVISSRTLDELSAMARLAAGLRSQLATQPMIGSQEPYDHIQDAGGG